MPRPNRIIFDGAVYHIYQRGNNKEFIFQNPNSKYFFIKKLKHYKTKFDYQVFAYTIMNNHYHLLIKTNTDPIDEIMFNINNVVSKHLNKELHRTGHLYENRYNSKIVDNNSYLIWVLRYIHRNPLRAGLCSNLEKYKWCSHNFYKYNNNNNDFVDIDYILNIISANRSAAIKQYLNIINSYGSDTNQTTDFEIFRNSMIPDINVKYSSIITSRDMKSLSLNSILDSIKIPKDLLPHLRQKGKNTKIIPYKIIFVKKAILYNYSIKEISEFLNITPKSLSKFNIYHKIYAKK